MKPCPYVDVADAMERANAAKDAREGPCFCDAQTGGLEPLSAERHGTVRRCRYECGACGIVFTRTELLEAR